jgi:predicted acetyltransferase
VSALEGIEVRTVAGDDYVSWSRAISTGFGNQLEADEDAERWRPGWEQDRAIGAYRGDRAVGTAGAYSFDMTVPGGASVPVCGVTAVTVQPSARRRGVLTAMMDFQHDQVAERGEPALILQASESNIYGRFGYGVAASQLAFEVETQRGRFRRPFADTGHVDEVSADEARKLFPSVHDAIVATRPGFLARSDVFWDRRFYDDKGERGGQSAYFFAAHTNAAGEVDGTALFRRKNSWNPVGPAGEIVMNELLATTPEATAALWRYVLDVDLVAKVSARNRPVDEPLRWLLHEPRRMSVTSMSDFLWLRLLDIPAMLSARSYEVADVVNLAVDDAFRPANRGTYRLEGGPDGATCARIDSLGDIALGVDDLGSTYLGGGSFSSLVTAGRATELVPGAAVRADRMFRTAVAPWSITGF